MKIIVSILLTLIITFILLIITMVEYIRQKKIVSETILIHLSGHPYLDVNSKVLFQIRLNNIIYLYNKKNDLKEEIPISELIKYEVKKESVIRCNKKFTGLISPRISDSDTGERTKMEEEYLILSYLQNGVEINCLFKQTRDLLGNIIEILKIMKSESHIQNHLITQKKEQGKALRQHS